MSLSAIRTLSFVLLFPVLFPAMVLADPSILERVERALSYEIPVVWAVRRFDAEEPYNSGSPAKPFLKIRFRAELELRRDTFDLDSLSGDASVLRRVHVAGELLEIFGVCSAREDGGKWHLEFQIDGSPFTYGGMVRSAFSGPTVVEGSKEHVAHMSTLSEVEKRRDARLKARLADERNAKAERHKAYAELSAELFSSIPSVISGNLPLEGSHEMRGLTSRQSPTVHTGFMISFFDYDRKSRSVKGNMTWNNGVEILVRGEVEGDDIRLLEVAWLNNPSRMEETFLRYDGKLFGGAKIVGRVCDNSEIATPCKETGSTFSVFLPESTVDLRSGRREIRTDVSVLAAD